MAATDGDFARRSCVRVVRSLAPALAIGLVFLSLVGPREGHADKANWPVFAHDEKGTSTEDEETILKPQNVRRLEEKWRITHVPDPHGGVYALAPVASNPAIVGGVAYFADLKGSVFAVDAKTGAVIWQHLAAMPFQSPAVAADFFPNGNFASGWAVGDDLVYFYGFNQVVRAFDRWTGAAALGWPTYMGCATPACGSRSAFAGTIVASSTSHQFTTTKQAINLIRSAAGGETLVVTMGNIGLVTTPDSTGSIAAYHARTGAPKWRLDTAIGTGGGIGLDVLSSIAFDRSRGLVFVGTGPNQAGPDEPDPLITPIADSLLALDVETGAIRWSHKLGAADDVIRTTTPFRYVIGRNWAVKDIHLMKLGARDVVVAGTQAGAYFALDRHSGHEILWSRQLTGPDINTFIHGMNEGAADEKAVFGASQYVIPGPDTTVTTTLGSTEVTLTTLDANPIEGAATAVFRLSARDGQQIWRRDFPGAMGTFAGTGTLALANGVLYFTNLGGKLMALDAENGSTLFERGVNQGSPEFNQLLGGVTVNNGRVYLPFGAGQKFFVFAEPFGPSGLLCLGLPGH
jgi:polyvinyl alcohol dehydrogenase (cytochrome)